MHFSWQESIIANNKGILSIKNENILPERHRKITFTFLINCKYAKDNNLTCEEEQKSKTHNTQEELSESADCNVPREQSDGASLFKWFNLNEIVDTDTADVQKIKAEAMQWACMVFTKGEISKSNVV